MSLQSARRGLTGGRNGSQPVYSEELVEEILHRLAHGESLRAICQDAHMPDEKAVRLWVIDRPDTLAPRYARAKEMGIDSIADQLLEFGSGDYSGPDGYVDNGAIQQQRLLSDNRKWYLSKLAPRKYGDKVTQELVGNPDAPIVTRIELVPVAPITRRLPKPDNE